MGTGHLYRQRGFNLVLRFSALNKCEYRIDAGFRDPAPCQPRGMEHRSRLHVSWLERKMTTQKDTRFLAGVIAVASVLLAAWVTLASYQPVTVADADIVTQVTTR